MGIDFLDIQYLAVGNSKKRIFKKMGFKTFAYYVKRYLRYILYVQKKILF